MIDIIVTQRMNVGMEDGFEAVARQLEAGTPARDQGCRRYEWYRSAELQTFMLLERWTETASAQSASTRTAFLVADAEASGEPAWEKFRVVGLVRLS
jgi:quinol monooxygenase YgiN